ncbi:transcriptional regulator, GntR family [Shimia gijangensis]|uniref:Transcriptional regulator, GntR family n=1 Tax=Shimia gijangensis TaxID=1470563 RepID=A0A1M6RZ52_9RHOB|nr:phosphonate metabolism transcriptional regulator PhnF [Shimia gijangensis]SHK37832.1 transcriptional regulator, GntR family [Shimia gijangensis]
MNRFHKKTPLWESIARSLTSDITEGQYGPGDKLPTEAELAARFDVNRHTVRAALKDMAESGLVTSRRGAGVFVAETPADYPLGKRVRFHSNLEQSGRLPTKKTLSVETRQADQNEAQALGITKGDPVHVFEGLSLADDQPIVLFRSVFSADRLPEMVEHIAYSNSVTAALQACGVKDYTRSSTRVTALRATSTQAHHLHIREGDPVLRTLGINVDPNGTPTEFCTSWFAGDRVTLSLTDTDMP